MAIIEALLPLLLRLIGMAIDSDKYSKEQKESFNAFVLAIQPTQTSSAQINQSYEAQVEELKKQMNQKQGE